MLLCGLHCESERTEVSLMVVTHIYKGKKSRKKDVCAGIGDTGTLSVHLTAELTAQTTVLRIKAAPLSSRLRAFLGSLICCKSTHEACTGILTLLPRQWFTLSLFWSRWPRHSSPQNTTFQGTINNRWTLLTSLGLWKLRLKPYIYK